MSEFSGHLSLLAAVRDHGRTVLAAQSFRAPYHISKPYWDADARALLVQVVNPTAGILSGDRLESEIAVQRNAALLVTTPSASRVFQMRNGSAECRQHFAVSADGWLEVMPEPLVPHRGSRYRQVTTIEVDAGGTLFFVDQLMPGRIAHRETWAWEHLQLEVTVRVGGEMVLRERLDQRGDDLRLLAELAGSGPTACFANAVLVAGGSAPVHSRGEGTPPKSEAAPWRNEVGALHRDGVWLGLSALRRHGWSIKVVAPNSIQLRATLREMRRILAAYFPRLRCDARKL
jgi:urease accessory protein